MIVHVLHRGFTLCQFCTALPGDWPPGHKWVGRDDIKNATCQECISIAEGKLLVPALKMEVSPARKIVNEEWQRAVKEYELRPGCVTAVVIARITNRLDEIGA